ncbi:MAG: hypothetical protein SFZ03_00465 [Candidatus Melainabacteria bacterium]|nr:hypothetical protein [Candidatus Melainabacteria bacterium]
MAILAASGYNQSVLVAMPAGGTPSVMIAPVAACFRGAFSMMTGDESWLNKSARGQLLPWTGGLLVVLALFYMLAFYFARDGWGYAGYHGFHRGPSFFFWGGPSWYAGDVGHYAGGRSVRGDSIRGTGRSDGLGGGK